MSHFEENMFTIKCWEIRWQPVFCKDSWKMCLFFCCCGSRQFVHDLDSWCDLVWEVKNILHKIPGDIFFVKGFRANESFLGRE